MTQPQPHESSPNSPEERLIEPEIALRAGRIATVQSKSRMPFIHKLLPDLRSQLAPGQVIDPCPPLARMPQTRFNNRPSREF